jgi:hypothetical protein
MKVLSMTEVHEVIAKPNTVTIYDPPSGWRYGFPKQFLPEGLSVAATLVRDGYPKKDAEWAAQHTRYWEEKI